MRQIKVWAVPRTAHGPKKQRHMHAAALCTRTDNAELEQITLNISSPLLFSPRQVSKEIMHICPHFCDIYKAYRSLVTAAELFEDIWTRIYPAPCEGSSTTNSRCHQINPLYLISQGGCPPFIRRPSLTKSIRNSGISHSALVALKIVPWPALLFSTHHTSTKVLDFLRKSGKHSNWLGCFPKMFKLWISKSRGLINSTQHEWMIWQRTHSWRVWRTRMKFYTIGWVPSPCKYSNCLPATWNYNRTVLPPPSHSNAEAEWEITRDSL